MIKNERIRMAVFALEAAVREDTLARAAQEWYEIKVSEAREALSEEIEAG